MANAIKFIKIDQLELSNTINTGWNCSFDSICNVANKLKDMDSSPNKVKALMLGKLYNSSNNEQTIMRINSFYQLVYNIKTYGYINPIDNTLDEYITHMQNNFDRAISFPEHWMPRVFINQHNQVQINEGRHRLASCYVNGITKLPVVYVSPIVLEKEQVTNAYRVLDKNVLLACAKYKK